LCIFLNFLLFLLDSAWNFWLFAFKAEVLVNTLSKLIRLFVALRTETYVPYRLLLSFEKGQLLIWFWQLFRIFDCWTFWKILIWALFIQYCPLLKLHSFFFSMIMALFEVKQALRTNVCCHLFTVLVYYSAILITYMPQGFVIAWSPINWLEIHTVWMKVYWSLVGIKAVVVYFFIHKALIFMSVHSWGILKIRICYTINWSHWIINW